MSNLKEHIKIWKHLFLVLFVLFSLSSCSAKQSILNTFELDLSETANKTRATGTAKNSCSFFNLTNKGQGNRSLIKEADYQRYGSKAAALSEWRRHTPTLNSGATSANSPPKYILFKRLKVYLA